MIGENEFMRLYLGSLEQSTHPLCVNRAALRAGRLPWVPVAEGAAAWKRKH